MPPTHPDEPTRAPAAGAGAPAAREQELRQACAELDRRLRAGEACDAEALLAAHPALAGDADAALELIYTEFVAREQLGQRPDPAAWCARFPRWRPQLEELFAVHRAVCGPDGPATAAPTVIDIAAAAAPGAGDGRAGGYELRGEIGRGGMGVVYQARDLALGRDVAVKLLQDGYPADSAVARRFVGEARITGQLQHPGIPAVYQVGTLGDGRPFLAMKLIKGRTLDALLKERPGPAADRGRFLASFEQVCQAVGYAHSHGVIHRDLKPANIMVGAFGEVQVMDWGLAKVLAGRDGQPGPGADPGVPLATEVRPARSADDATQAGSLLGTPAFMPPEQAIGAVDHIDARSDVFGLGAVLCAVLTGQPPYVGEDVESVRQLAVRAKLGDAHARLEACGAGPELVALCRRCLAPEKADRPADAGEVARAVADLRAAAEERARRAEVERAAAEARAAEQRRRRRAQLALAASVGLLLLGAGAFAWWQDRQAAARQAQLARNAGALADLVGQGEEALRADDADRAAAALEQIDRRLPEGGGEAVVDRAGRCRRDLDLLRELDAIDTSLWTRMEKKLPSPMKRRAARWREALAGYGVLPGTTPPEEAAERVGESLIRDRLLFALDLWLMHDPSPEVRAVLKVADPEPYRDAVRDAVAAEDAAGLADLAGRAEALAQPNRFAVLLGSHRAVPAERRRAVLEAAALRARPGDLIVLMSLGNSFSRNNSREGVAEQVRWYQAAAAAHPRSVMAHYNLAISLKDRGDLDGALAHLREAVHLDAQFAMGHKNLGNVLQARGDPDGAIAAYRRAISLDPKDALAHNDLGNALQGKGDPDGQITEYREAISLDPNFALAYYNLGSALQDKEDWDGAIAAYRRAVSIDPKFAYAHNNLGNALVGKGDPDGAIAAYRQAISLDPKDHLAHFNLGRALKLKGDLSGATARFQEVIRLDPTFAPAHNSLAGVLATGPDGMRDGKRAVEHASRACELTGWKSPGHLQTLAAACAEAGDFEKAVEHQKKALSFPAFEKANGAAARQRLDLYARKRPYRDPALAPPELLPPPQEVRQP